MIPFGCVGGLQVRVTAVASIDVTRDSTGPGTGIHNQKIQQHEIINGYFNQYTAGEHGIWKHAMSNWIMKLVGRQLKSVCY